MNRKSTLTFILFQFLFLSIFCQTGIVSGTLSDETGPLPGATVLVKGTQQGTETDFDGNYSIQCSVGDILVISFIGMKTQEIKVTASMFDYSEVGNVQYSPTKRIYSNAYKNAIHNLKKEEDTITKLSNSKRTYNAIPFSVNYNRIKDINIKNEQVLLTYFNPDIYFEINVDTNIGIQFVKNSNTHSLQNTYSQGISINNNYTHQGPETNSFFSYGPELNTLTYDGSNYIYDTNGKLITNGNGTPANIYDNAILKTGINSTNRVSFSLNTNEKLLKFIFSNKSVANIFGSPQKTTNKLNLHYRTGSDFYNHWSSFISYETIKDKQPNTNGFYNNLLLNSWATPISFSNQQGASLANKTQRRFSNNFNNTAWLLNNNQNSNTISSLVATIKNKKNIGYGIQLNSQLSYSKNHIKQQFGLPLGTFGFENGFLSTKNNTLQRINANLNFDYHINDHIQVKSIIDYNYEHLDFTFKELSNFNDITFTNPSNSEINATSISRNKITLLNQFKYDINRILQLKFTNNSYYSSIQKNAWFLQSFNAELDLDEWFRMYDIHKFTIGATVSFDVNDASLYYNNQNHNSLQITPQQSAFYTTNNDLFTTPSLDLEKKESYEINSSFSFPLFGYNNTSIGITYYHSKTKGSVFPILQNNTFVLDNVANIRNQGFEFVIDYKVELAYDFYYQPIITFSTYNTKVLKLLNNENRIPIAGFSSTSKNLIEGQPVGVIVGSAYTRDENNAIRIGNDGFPLVDSNPKIIGNPIPDFSLGIQNNFTWERLSLNINLDIQKGGDIWNGTQNVLNYLGTSTQSATQRNTSNFIFNGVNSLGNVNTTPVDFYNPNNPISENRFVRYGFEGVAEDAIVDGSYLNIKSINVSFKILGEGDRHFFRELKLGMYANNLVTWTSFEGQSPYSTLYGNSGTSALNFFNTPLQTEIGFSLHLKI